ncbi:MAG: GNAT family N-acetyltransferase, partial [Hyphomicrobiales bacterium]
FEEFLANPHGRYAVVQDGGRLVGCGGYVTGREGKNARLVWGMIAPDCHGRGLGRLLALTRLRWIAALEGVERVSLDTSQKTAGFYLLFGFGPAKVVHDGYGPGLDRVDMELALDANAREILTGGATQRDAHIA